MKINFLKYFLWFLLPTFLSQDLFCQQAKLDSMIAITQNAAVEVKRLFDKQGNPKLGLRVGVQGGGCSGLSYKLGFDQERQGDQIHELNGVKVFVDPKSDLYLEGTTLDFLDGLEGRGMENCNRRRRMAAAAG